jgi:uncharacterized protein YjiK
MERGKKIFGNVSMGLAVTLMFNFCTYSQQEKDKTTLSGSPDLVYEIHYLPDNLREISGIAIIDSITLACIQDENGIIYLYDLKTDKVAKQIQFGPDGDYEDICLAQNTLYVLRSDGMLFVVRDYLKDKIDIQSYVLQLPSDNNEGLCYDHENERLLIAAKSKVGKTKEVKDLRLIFGFSLKTKKPEPDPAFTINQDRIMDFALSHNIPVPFKVKKDGTAGKPILKVHPSAIALHPITHKMYILSADDHFLLVFNKSGTIEQLVQLNASLFNKAEGMAFFVNGDILISNEGQSGRASIIRMDAQKIAELFRSETSL